MEKVAANYVSSLKRWFFFFFTYGKPLGRYTLYITNSKSYGCVLRDLQVTYFPHGRLLAFDDKAGRTSATPRHPPDVQTK
jgi:hypothetical protein